MPEFRAFDFSDLAKYIVASRHSTLGQLTNSIRSAGAAHPSEHVRAVTRNLPLSIGALMDARMVLVSANVSLSRGVVLRATPTGENS